MSAHIAHIGDLLIAHLQAHRPPGQHPLTT